VDAAYEKILARIKKGNAPHVKQQLRANREKVKARLAKQETTTKSS